MDPANRLDRLIDEMLAAHDAAFEESRQERLARIRETLHPTREGYCAEPLEIEDARWLLAQVER